MAKFIYLYGHGETMKKNDEKIIILGCYLKCEIPDETIRSGFFPSVLHAYIMYAKDIGLLVSEVFYDSKDEKTISDQLVYSLWSLFYVNNSSISSNEDNSGIGIWEIQQESATEFQLKLDYRLKLDTEFGIYYRDVVQKNTINTILNQAKLQQNPQPTPNNYVNSDTAWYLDLTSPEPSPGNASSYAIIQHYNNLVIWDTLLDMQNNLEESKGKVTYMGLKQANGQVLKAVTDRKYAYDALVPKWSKDWNKTEPDGYKIMGIAMNNYNIAASIFSHKGSDNSDENELRLLGTAANIKGQLKSGHAETRLLLTIDTIDNANRGSTENWFTDVCGYFKFNNDKKVNINRIYDTYNGSNISLISSLKPCYMCSGEVDATFDGIIKEINGKTIDMWACFPNLTYQPKIKNVLYFDIDRPISYPSSIETTITVDNKTTFTWKMYLSPWSQWSAFLYNVNASNLDYINPIGPRIVEPAGECLKTGDAFTRYKNSAYFLLTDDKEYKEELINLTDNFSNLNLEK